MTRAIYAGSFDPFTFGHKAVADEAVKLFGHVIIAVGTNSVKTPLFKAEEKIKMIRGYWPEEEIGVDNKVHVTTFSGLLAKFCREWTKDQVALIRGLRAVSDFESEMAIAAANRKLNDRASTVFVPTLPEVAYISSSVVKEIARLTRDVGDLLPYVPEKVAEELIRRLQPPKVFSPVLR